MDQVEEFRVKGDELLGKVKEWIHEGNVRHLTINPNKTHQTLHPRPGRPSERDAPRHA